VCRKSKQVSKQKYLEGATNQTVTMHRAKLIPNINVYSCCLTVPETSSCARSWRSLRCGRASLILENVLLLINERHQLSHHVRHLQYGVSTAYSITWL